MNMKFAIKSIAGEAEKQGDEYIRFTGISEPFRNGSERKCRKVGEIGFGPTKEVQVVFVTGLDEDLVNFYSWYTDEEKEEVRKFIIDNKTLLEKFYGGSDVLDPKNKFFWTTKDVFSLHVDNYKLDKLFDTKNPNECLTYLGIIGGAWLDLVAPNREWAEKNPNTPYYLALEKEASDSDSKVYVNKLAAQAALSEISEDSGDGLFILAWCIQYDTLAYGAYSRIMTPRSELIKYHSMYIDGLVPNKKNRKKDYPKTFLDYAKRWKGQQTKNAILVEAYVKAGEYYGFINSSKKKYVTDEGTVLGNTIDEAVQTIMLSKHVDDLERLRDKVEKKWNE